jgi:hypothetical protein
VSKLNKRVFRATGAAAIAETLAPASAYQIEEIRLHLSAAGGAAENLTVTLDCAAGVEHDIVIKTEAMAAVVDLLYQPTRPLIFSAGDEIDFAYANTNTRTWGLTVYWTPIY